MNNQPNETTVPVAIDFHLNPLQVICGRHGELFRPRWPVGYVEFSTTGLECLLTQPTFQHAIERELNEQISPMSDRICDAVSRLIIKSPICCRLPARDLKEVYLEANKKAGIWDTRRCVLCGTKAPGAVYRKTPPTAKSTAPAGTWDHVCVDCVCNAPVSLYGRRATRRG